MATKLLENNLSTMHTSSVSAVAGNTHVPHQQVQAARTHEHVSRAHYVSRALGGYTVGAW